MFKVRCSMFDVRCSMFGQRPPWRRSPVAYPFRIMVTMYARRPCQAILSQRNIDAEEHVACVPIGQGYSAPVPRKIRQLISDLEKAGFVNRGGKGSHRNFVHAHSCTNVTLSGKSGDDARIYQEKDVKEAIKKASGQ
jgi:predicted RNA binding protein YcfA (HicA-like mRNA interferase family)